MKIGIQTWGSDGDILPFIALAGGLRESGHDVTVVYTSIDNKDYTPYGERFDIGVVKAYEKFDVKTAEVFAEITDAKDPLKEFNLVLEKYFDPAVEDMYAASEKLCAESDLVIGHAIHYPLATASEITGCPRVPVHLCPMTVATQYVSPFDNNLGKWLNSILWKIGDRIVRKKIFPKADRLRKAKGLAPFKNLQEGLYIGKELTLIATCSPLCPRPPDWNSGIGICGFLKPPEMSGTWEMEAELQQFLEAGKPPVYFTFGSCTQFDLERTTRLFLEAAGKSGQRAIIQSDWDNFPQGMETPDIFTVKTIPHEHVFPHCSLIVHHGGSGTTQSSLRAGKPSVVVAHAFDQPFWGKRLQQAGVAGRVLSRRTVTADALANGIQAVVHDPAMSTRAKEAGMTVREENGVANAVSLIEERFH